MQARENIARRCWHRPNKMQRTTKSMKLSLLQSICRKTHLKFHPSNEMARIQNNRIPWNTQGVHALAHQTRSASENKRFLPECERGSDTHIQEYKSYINIAYSNNIITGVTAWNWPFDRCWDCSVNKTKTNRPTINQEVKTKQKKNRLPLCWVACCAVLQ